MDLESFRFLLTDEGQALLADLAAREISEAEALREASRLRRSYPPPLVSAALETAILRRRAARKFSRAQQMYFTREALEQATAEPVARYRARRFAGYGLVADLGSSIGGDAIALAERGPVLAVDRDPLRLAMLIENAQAYEVAQMITPLQADLSTLELPPEVEAFFFDPARREGGRRRFSAAAYVPPLTTIERWRRRVPAGAIKVAPGIADEELPPECEAEFISLDGELREACLWLGPLRRSARRATLLPQGVSLDDEPTPAAPLSEPLRYLYEPDPAVIRAHLVAQLAARIDAAQLDAEIAYLTSDRLVETAFARVWEIEEWLPFNLKALRRRLQELGVGEVTVKKRGSPIAPEELRRLLRLKGSGQRTVVLTQLRDRPVALICKAPIRHFNLHPVR